MTEKQFAMQVKESLQTDISLEDVRKIIRKTREMEKNLFQAGEILDDANFLTGPTYANKRIDQKTFENQMSRALQLKKDYIHEIMDTFFYLLINHFHACESVSFKNFGTFQIWNYYSEDPYMLARNKLDSDNKRILIFKPAPYLKRHLKDRQIA